MRRYYAVLGALTFSVICTSLYLMTENLTSNSHNVQFEPINKGNIDSKIKAIESRLRHSEKVLELVKDTVSNLSNAKAVQKVLADKLQHVESVTERRTEDNNKAVIVQAQDVTMCLLLSKRLRAKSDIQMLDVFAELPFDNPDGGAWKQGYPISYDSAQWNTEKLLVFVVPHSHNDPGWVKTFQQYYNEQTKHILDKMLTKLEQYPRMRFIYAEMSFFSTWWQDLDVSRREAVKKLLAENRLELVTAGWVMTDEANAHYYAMVDQLIEGNQWLMSEVGVRPVSGWAIDPFGHSSTMPYLLKRTGIRNMLIQRIHYAVKKRLSLKKELEFIWRQNWDEGDSTDILCHMMPFYSYDIPHTCGPEPAICCQFDFKRLPGDRITCPWNIPPVPISPNNVAERAYMLLDQYRKKAQLYRNNVVFAPLGDDFRYDTDKEWDVQYQNYQQLFDYMNSRSDWHVEARFGTLTDYFNAIRQRSGMSQDTQQPKGFPVLAGDFFTYADREQDYWSGYYTSRPFYKRLDRVLEHHLRACEILFSLARAHTKRVGVTSLPMDDLTRELTSARRSLGLFQHHDGVTGTSKDFVVVDYGIRLLNAITDTKKIMQVCAHFLLTSDRTQYASNPSYFSVDEVRAAHDSLPEKTKITVSSEPREVVFYNSLAHFRQAVVRLHVTDPKVIVTDSQGQVVPSQTDPYWTTQEQYATDIFKLTFVIKVPALGLVRYSLVKASSENPPAANVMSRAVIYNAKAAVSQREPFVVELGTLDKFSVETSKLTLEFNNINGLLKSVVDKANGKRTDVNIKFVQYSARPGRESSGAYLFLPAGDSEEVIVPSPTVRVVRGPIQSEVHVFYPQVEHVVRISECAGVEGAAVDIHNLVDMTGENNRELAMRLETSVQNKDLTFYSDLNGFQMQKRRTLHKLPLQANFYPMPSAAYLQDDVTRVTLLSGQSLGVASLKTGWLEVIQDRRLMQDDSRGVGQGVTDNKRTPNLFRIVIEHCVFYSQDEGGATGHLTHVSHLLSRELIHPVVVMPRRDPGKDTSQSSVYTPLSAELQCDLHLVNLKSMTSDDTALLLHHVVAECSYTIWGATRYTCPLHGNDVVDTATVFKDLTAGNVRTSSLSLLSDTPVPSASVTVPPMEIVAVKMTLQ